jgi:hypothetical protein
MWTDLGKTLQLFVKRTTKQGACLMQQQARDDLGHPCWQLLLPHHADLLQLAPFRLVEYFVR